MQSPMKISARILELLKQHGQLTAQDIAAMTGRTTSQNANPLARLRGKDGYERQVRICAYIPRPDITRGRPVLAVYKLGKAPDVPKPPEAVTEEARKARVCANKRRYYHKNKALIRMRSRLSRGNEVNMWTPLLWR